MTTESVPRATRAVLGLEALREVVDGRLVTPADAGWDRARRPWQVAVDQHPLAVLEVDGPGDVVAAVSWATLHGVPVTAQPIGHGATTSLEGVLVLRTRALDGIAVDAPARRARVGAGVKVGELLEALQGSGLTFLAGSSPDPTVVGLALGGGMSWFGRSWGLTANDVTAVEMVRADGTTLHVTAASDPELFWAVRGGGGDFGIVTEIEIALHPAPALYGGRLLWQVDRLPQVLRAFRQVTADAPPELTAWLHVYRFPPIPQIPEPLRGNAFASVAVTYLGPAAEAERLLAPLRAVVHPVVDQMGVVPMCHLGTVCDEPLDPTPTIEASWLLDDLDDEVVERLDLVLGEHSASTLMIAQIRHLGGALTRRRPGDGAAGAVDEPYLLFALGIPAAPGLAEAIAGDLARLGAAVEGHGPDRTVPNFLGSSGDHRRARAPEVLARLRAVKREVDPRGTIRSNRPVDD